MSAITCMSWVRRGVSKRMPDRIKLEEDQMKMLISDSKDKNEDNLEDSDADADDDVDTQTQVSDENDLNKKYQLDQYDDDEEDSDSFSDDSADETDDTDQEDVTDTANVDVKKSRGKNQSSALAMAGLSYYHSNKQDPYMNEPDSSDDETEILPDDNLLAIGKVNDDMYGLELYVYNENSSSLYCHHDTLLGSFPLAMEWVGYDPGETTSAGNLLAVGGMKPDIELWDVDVIDILEPAYVLKGYSKKRSKKKLKSSSSMGHHDAVLSLSWNPLREQVLASGSADKTIGLWDLDEGQMVTVLEHHEEKVQALCWHPFEYQTLLSGSCDSTVNVFDCRSYESAHKSWSLPGEVEHVTWNRHNPYYFLAGTECGHVLCFDVRMSDPVFSVKAHEAAISGLDVSSEVPGCLVTSSLDKMVKVWDIRQNKPEKVQEKKSSIGNVLSMSPCPDSGFVYAIGGEHELRILHLKTFQSVVDRFSIDVPSDDKDAAKTVKSADKPNASLPAKAPNRDIHRDVKKVKKKIPLKKELKKAKTPDKSLKKVKKGAVSSTGISQPVKLKKRVQKDTTPLEIKKRKKLKKV